MESTVDLRMVFSGLSLVFTAYFWFVKARKDRPNLRFHQLSNFRVSCRRHPDREGTKRLCLQQLDTGGVLIVNHSTRQNSVVLFECFLLTDEEAIRGEWGYAGEDKPPWNVGPESTISFSPACVFDVPEEFEVPENPEFEVCFLTASGKQFWHTFTKSAPRMRAAETPRRQAA